MAGRKKSVSVQEELLLCPSAKPGDWFPGIPVSAVAGIDEAGRGCLAGPVVAAAVILPEGAVIPGLADSKVLSCGVLAIVPAPEIHCGRRRAGPGHFSGVHHRQDVPGHAYGQARQPLSRLWFRQA